MLAGNALKGLSGFQCATTGDTADIIQCVNRLAVPRNLFAGLAQQKAFGCDTVEVVGFGIEVVLHALDAFVKMVADLSVAVDPVDFVVRHRCTLCKG